MDFVAAVDRDRQRGQMLNRLRARQDADVDRAQAREQLHQCRCLRPRGLRVAADELVAVERPLEIVEQMRGNGLECSGDAHIDKMAKKDLGKDSYPFRKAGEVRIVVKIEPDKVHTNG